MFVATRSSKLRQNAEKSFETVVFESHKAKKKKLEGGNALIGEKNIKEVDEDEMRKFRYDIMKFGASGFDKTKKKETKIAVAVSLGAKPPKRGYKNYKEILDEKKKDKEERERVKELFMKGKADPGAVYRKANVKEKAKKKGMRGLLNVYGKVRTSLVR